MSRAQIGVLEMKCERSGVDPGELEEIVDDCREQTHLLVEGREILLGLADSVGERLDHRLHRRERRLEVVAGPGDELPPGIKETFERAGHGVERCPELGKLGRAGFGRAARQIARGDLGRGRAKPFDRKNDPVAEQQRGKNSRACCRDRDRQDLRVGVHVEHDPAGREDGSKRKHDCEEREAGELEPDRRKEAERQRRSEPDSKCRDGQEERDQRHGINL